MWKALKALLGKIAGQAPPVPAPARKPVPPISPLSKQSLGQDRLTPARTSIPEPLPQAAISRRDPLWAVAGQPLTVSGETKEQGPPEPVFQSSRPGISWDSFRPSVGGGVFSVQVVEKPLQTGRGLTETGQFSGPRPTPTAKSINSFGAKNEIGPRIASIASSTSSSRAVSSIAPAQLRQFKAKPR